MAMAVCIPLCSATCMYGTCWNRNRQRQPSVGSPQGPPAGGVHALWYATLLPGCCFSRVHLCGAGDRGDNGCAAAGWVRHAPCQGRGCRAAEPGRSSPSPGHTRHDISLCSSSGGAVYAEVATQVQCRGRCCRQYTFCGRLSFSDCPCLRRSATLPPRLFGCLPSYDCGLASAVHAALRHGSKQFAGAVASTVYRTSLQTHGQGFNHATNFMVVSAVLICTRVCFTLGIGNLHSSEAVRLPERCMHSGQCSVCTKALQQPFEPDVSQNGVEHNDAHHRRDAIYLQQPSNRHEALLDSGALLCTWCPHAARDAHSEMLTISLTAQKPRTVFVIPGGIVTFSPRIPVFRQ
jgi:hypothetical protein